MTISIVTDLGYGDCGKGTTVDHLARQGPSLVVRHNGGPQAGHNVVTPEGVHHCFSQFGSGTLAGAKTFLSRFMLINPLNMIREADHLISIGEVDVWRRVFVDENCVLITPWHSAINRLEEQSRGVNRHGSCGQGVGVAMRQSLDMAGLSVRVKDIRDTSTLWGRLEALRTYLKETYQHLSGDTPEWGAVEDSDVSLYLAHRFQQWIELVHVAASEYLEVAINNHEHTIFEGAQGVLLDQDYGFHPYTTWSTCTHDNALTLLNEYPPSLFHRKETVIRLGVIRAVTTRHGPGPHPTEDFYLTNQWVEPHNAEGPWQGRLRVGHLDLCAHRYAATVCGGVDQIVVTHLDRSSQWLYTPHYQQMLNIPVPLKGDRKTQQQIGDTVCVATPVLVPANTDQLLSAIETQLDTPVVMTSHGPSCRDKVVRLAIEKVV